MRKSLSKLVAAASPHGNLQAVRQLGREVTRWSADAIALLGSLTPKGADPKEYGRTLKALHEAVAQAGKARTRDDNTSLSFRRLLEAVPVRLG